MLMQILRRFGLLLSLLLFTACTVDVDEEELSEQLDEVYNACKNEGIDDIESFESVLNSGGNNLSKACRVALGNVDFAGIVSAFDVSLDFEVPSPGKEINPLISNASSWQELSEWSAADSLVHVSTGLDIAGQPDVIVQGVDSSGAITELSDFTISDITSGDDVAISYTTDYSGSMLQSDIVAVDGYFQDFHAILPNTTPASVTIFSDELTPKTNGFVTDSTVVNAALSFDGTYSRASTALYDAWGDALTKLDAQNKNILLNVITTDGFENSSTTYTNFNSVRQKIVDSNAFNIIIASSWAETSVLEGLVDGKGIVVYKYQIDEAQNIVANLKTMLSNVKVVKVNDDVSGYASLNLIYSDETKISITLP